MSHPPRCQFESVEPRVHLARAEPSPAENVYFRLPLSSDTSVHYYYDRNESAAAALAWNGSTTQTYDDHNGTDFSGGPRGRAVFASAPGILIAKDDGWGDGAGPGNGNYVRINHGNNRAGLPINSVYLHFEAGTPTTKPIGSFIAVGEQIGGVGTSGNSTGLHLHLETQVNRVAFDPYKAIGSNEASWWVNQGTGAPSTTPQPAKFVVGDLAQVYETSQGGGGTLNVRGPNPTSGVIGTRPDASIGTVLEGPVWAAFGNDYNNSLWVWYKVRWAGGLEGWSAQNWLRKPADVTPPVVVGTSFLFETTPQRLQVGFSENVAASLDGNDFEVRNIVTGQMFGVGATFDAATNVATVSLGGTLSDGNYHLRTKSAGITDAAGNGLVADSEYDFFFLNADANHDRSVNLDDFTALATNFGLSGKVFSEGDFNFNGSVNLTDFTILASKFGENLPSAGDLPELAARRPVAAPNSAFNVKPIATLNQELDLAQPTDRLDLPV